MVRESDQRRSEQVRGQQGFLPSLRYFQWVDMCTSRSLKRVLQEVLHKVMLACSRQSDPKDQDACWSICQWGTCSDVLIG